MNNLRLGYYYGFYNEYGRDYIFSGEIKQDQELLGLILAIDKKIYSSEVFRRRLQLLDADCKAVKAMSQKQIEDILEQEDIRNRESYGIK